MTDTATLYCYVHPNRPTSLRCNRCERPICAQCAIKTPTGYRCKNCVREQMKTFETAVWYDYLAGLTVTALLSMAASALLALISTFIGFFMIFIAIAAAGGAGVFISDMALRAIRKHRSQLLFITCAAGVVLGALPVVLFQIITFNYYSLISLGIFVFVATPTVFARLSGIQFTR
jgi:hypothetical protein